MNYLLDRVTSHHDCSIGTSIALQSIVEGSRSGYDDTEIKKNDCSKYDTMCINVYTLCRNILSACSSEYIQYVKEEDLRAVLLAEIAYIADALSNAFQTVSFYYCQYSDLQKNHPFAKLLSDNTDRQKHATYLIVRAVSKIMDTQSQMDDKDKEKIKVFKNNFAIEDNKNVLLLTNQPYNLLALGSSSRSSLIESHTASIKSRPLWYTKLHMAKQETWMPFNHVTLQLFGDGTLFQSYPKVYRDYLLEVGRKFKWNSDTTLDRIRLNVSFDRDNPIRHDILDLF